MAVRKDYEAFLNDKGFFGAIGMHNLSSQLSTERYGQPVKGYHVLMTEPYFYEHPGTEFYLKDYELLTAELSALLWHRYNGPVFLVTDKKGYQYIRDTSLCSVYDEILPILDRKNYGIAPNKYWASGKIQALMKIHAPCAVIDMDLMVWRPLELLKYPLAAAHTEHLTPYIYPSFDFFKVNPGYTFPTGWDSTAEPLNTSIVFFSDDIFKNYYASESVRFMQAEKETPDNGVICMVFAEQRILAMCAEEKEKSVHVFLDYDNLCSPQDLITHIWSAKDLIGEEQELKEIYIAMCKNKIQQLSFG